MRKTTQQVRDSLKRPSQSIKEQGDIRSLVACCAVCVCVCVCVCACLFDCVCVCVSVCMVMVKETTSNVHNKEETETSTQVMQSCFSFPSGFVVLLATSHDFHTLFFLHRQ